MLDAVDLGKHLFHRQCDEVFHFGRACARKRNEHIREGHVDLRLFLAWRDDDREYAEHHRCKRQQRRQCVVLEAGGEAARDAEPILHLSLPSAT